MFCRTTAAIAAALTLVLLATACKQEQLANQPEAKLAAKPAAVLAGRSVLAGGVVVSTVCKDSSGNVVPNVVGQPLLDPPKLTAQQGNLTVNLDIKQLPVSVPTLVNGNCVMQSFNLREYGVNAANYSFPAPTLVLNKAMGSTPGDRLTVNLSNHLSTSPGGCIEAGNPQCVCTGTNQPQCCSASGSTPPDCFHDLNTTNLHFHGLHVSPQSPQDYVLLELAPAGSTQTHAAHSSAGTTAVGNFTYAVNPLPSNQAPGTHWYHPHKHGSTAAQVGNGMAGAILVRGEFDTQLQKMFNVLLNEHVMVVQFVHDLNFTQSATTTPAALVNGLYQPNLQMQAGEIQRWRFIGATMEGAAQIAVNFTGLTAVQIAMDGVQFSNTNYLCQPLLHSTQVTPPCTLQPSSNLSFQLSPGNRADFLVQAPSTPGTYGVSFQVFGNTERQGTQQLQGGPRGQGKRQPTVENVKAALKAFAPLAGTAPGLFTVTVNACTDHCAMKYPSAMPPMPSYLSNIPSTTDGSQVVQFRLDKTSGTPGTPGAQPQLFGIGVQNQSGGATQQFSGNCANFTEPLNRTETWTISQNTNSGTAPFHVFHIHTNPFQLVSSGTNDGSSSITYPDPIWMDSITLPSNTSPGDGFPTNANSTVVIRQRFEDYTGAYVLHCHFLGHEDRGMMMMVQTVCPNAAGYYGQTVSNGGPDNCSICGSGGPCPQALPPCGSTTSAAAAKKTSK
jgi:FtsP/CotA-like multicopper oxidase with cupredoxin domain